MKDVRARDAQCNKCGLKVYSAHCCRKHKKGLGRLVTFKRYISVDDEEVEDSISVAIEQFFSQVGSIYHSVEPLMIQVKVKWKVVLIYDNNFQRTVE